MSISRADAFAFLSQDHLLVTPVFTSDLRAGHFGLKYFDFPNKLIDILFVERMEDKKYEWLREMFYWYVEANTEWWVELINIDNYNGIIKGIADKDEKLKNIFFELISEMEASIWDHKRNDFANKEVRRILWLWNWWDFHEYRPGISSEECNKPVKKLLRWDKTPSDIDKTKTLEEELVGDIAIIAKRINEILWRTVITEDWRILDDSVSVFTALDGFDEGEVYLRVNGKIVDAKPPHGRRWEE